MACWTAAIARRAGCRFPHSMSEDDSSHSAPEPHEKRRNWLERLGAAFSGEPHTRDELVALLRTAQQDEPIESDTLRMMEAPCRWPSSPWAT